MSFHELKGIWAAWPFLELNFQTLGSLHSGEPKSGGAGGWGRHFLLQLQPEARQDPPPGGKGTRKVDLQGGGTYSGSDSRIRFPSQWTSS